MYRQINRQFFNTKEREKERGGTQNIYYIYVYLLFRYRFIFPADLTLRGYPFHEGVLRHTRWRDEYRVRLVITATEV